MQPQAPKARLVSLPAPAPRTGPAPLPDGTNTTTVLSLAQEGCRSNASTKAKGSTKNGGQDGGHNASNGAKGASGEGPKQTPAPAIVAAMVASEVLAASPLWGPPGSPSSGVPNWPSDCPPCAAPVTVSCLGGHEQREVPCSVACPYSCTRPCGRPLACGACTGMCGVRAVCVPLACGACMRVQYVPLACGAYTGMWCVRSMRPWRVVRANPLWLLKASKRAAGWLAQWICFHDRDTLSAFDDDTYPVCSCFMHAP
eukprot:1158701-Pelagomonas_calceolata.AAC.5